MAYSRARFASISFTILGILGVAAGNTGCRSAATAAAVSPSSVEQSDKYQWLEDVTGERSLTWVKMQNARSAKVLENDPRFSGLKEAALKVLESPDRLAIPRLHEGAVYNTWRDAEHVHGILRRTTLTDYLTPVTKPRASRCLTCTLPALI